MTKFIDANIFIKIAEDENSEGFFEGLNLNEHFTSVLVLAEAYHKLTKKNLRNVFQYMRLIMSAVTVLDIGQSDFFNAIKNPSDLNINDKIHIEIMKRNSIDTIISFDKDFDRDKTIKREEI